mgnify:CR=1 FL=1
MKKPFYNKTKYEDLLTHKTSYFFLKNFHARITVVQVLLNDDYSLATIYWDTLFDKNTIEENLNTHKKSLRVFIAKTLKVKAMPELRFIYSSSFESQKSIEELLKQ